MALITRFAPHDATEAIVRAVLAVAAVDDAGNRDATPVVHRWETDLTPPQVAVTFPPPTAATTGDAVAVCGSAGDERRLAEAADVAQEVQDGGRVLLRAA